MASQLFNNFFKDTEYLLGYENYKDQLNYFKELLKLDMNTGWRGGPSLSELYPGTEISSDTNSTPIVFRGREYTYSIPDFSKLKSISTSVLESAPTSVTTIKDDNYYMNLANDVIRGKYGNGQDRKQALGEDYTKVLQLVNLILKNNNRPNPISNFLHYTPPTNPTPGFRNDYAGNLIITHQNGGLMQQQDPVQIVIDGLNQNPQEMMQQLSLLSSLEGGKELVNAILLEIAKRAQAGDLKAALAVQVLQLAMNQTQSAKQGAKLQYIKHLKGICSDDEELVYMKKGGTMCPICLKKKEGAKMLNPKKKFFIEGDINNSDNITKKEKCGGKMKKKLLPKKACGGAMKKK